MALTKKDITENICKWPLYSRKEAVDYVEVLLEIMKRTMENGEDILISGFGKFNVKHKKERRGRNPATGEAMMLKKRKIVTFTPSGILREKVNGTFKEWWEKEEK